MTYNNVVMINKEQEYMNSKAPYKWIKKQIVGVLRVKEKLTLGELHFMFFPRNYVNMDKFVDKYINPLIKKKEIEFINFNQVNNLYKVMVRKIMKEEVNRDE